jgi:hypothetical protein
VFAPLIGAITLGIVGHGAFARRIGRNESFNHGGNAFAAAAAGISAYFWGPIVVFFLLAAMSIASLVSALAIPAMAIDNDLARGLHDRPGQRNETEQPSGFKVLVTCRPLLVFAACVLLFHFANAAMLPLVGQKLALQNQNQGTSLMSACIVAAQIVMVPMAMLVGVKADITVQCRAGGGDYSAWHWCGALDYGRGSHRGESRVQRRIPDARRCGRNRPAAALVRNAGNGGATHKQGCP